MDQELGTPKLTRCRCARALPFSASDPQPQPVDGRHGSERQTAKHGFYQPQWQLRTQQFGCCQSFRHSECCSLPWFPSHFLDAHCRARGRLASFPHAISCRLAAIPFLPSHSKASSISAWSPNREQFPGSTVVHSLVLTPTLKQNGQATSYK